MGGEWICLGVVDLLGIISFFLLSLVVRKLVVGYLKDTNAGEWVHPAERGNKEKGTATHLQSQVVNFIIS